MQDKMLLEIIHYGIAAACGICMVVAMLCCEGVNGFSWSAVFAGVYLASKAILLISLLKKGK